MTNTIKKLILLIDESDGKPSDGNDFFNQWKRKKLFSNLDKLVVLWENDYKIFKP